LIRNLHNQRDQSKKEEVIRLQIRVN